MNPAILLFCLHWKVLPRLHGHQFILCSRKKISTLSILMNPHLSFSLDSRQGLRQPLFSSSVLTRGGKSAFRCSFLSAFFWDKQSPSPDCLIIKCVSGTQKKKKSLYKISNQSSRKTWGLSLNKSKKLQWINGYILIKLQMQVTRSLTPKLEVQCLCRQPGWGIIILHPLQSTCFQYLYTLTVIPVEFFFFLSFNLSLQSSLEPLLCTRYCAYWQLHKED